MMRAVSEQCTARSKRSGQRCEHRVIGGGPCHLHGGKAPQVRQARERRIALAEALARDPRRDPGDVLRDVLHTNDHLMRKARAEVDADRPTAATMARLLEATERAGRWAKTSLDAEVDQRQTQVLEAHAAMLAGVIQRVLDRLALTPEQQQLVHIVVPEELERMSPAARELDGGTDGR